MLLALQNGVPILATNAKTGTEYYCPTCHAKLVFRHGKHKIAHFAHQKGNDCGVSEGESEEHLRGKQQIYNWAMYRGYQPRLEVYLPQINQRPDLLLKINQQTIAIEFQCSPLSLERLLERNQGYQSLGIRYWWLLGAPYQRHLRNGKVAQFTQLLNQQPVLLYWNTAAKRLIISDHWWQYSFTKQNLRKSDLVKYQVKMLERQQLFHPNQLIRSISAVSKMHPLALCPLVCHDHVASWPVLKQPIILWRIMVINWLNYYPLFTYWDKEKWNWHLQNLPNINWLPFACIPAEILYQRIIDQFNQDLLEALIIKKYQQGYVLIRRPQWFPNLSAKINAIESTRNFN